MSEPFSADSVYRFGCGATDPRAATAALVGNKAFNLIRMAAAGLPIPPGFALPTTYCRRYFQEGGRIPPDTAKAVSEGIADIECAAGLTFGGSRRPLLVSVRSGAAVSMPGMMDTILNVGLCDQTLAPLIRMTGNPRHAWDSYHRLIKAYAEVVCELPSGPFEQIVEDRMKQEAVPTPAELDVAALKNLTAAYLETFQSLKGEPFPQDPHTQLQGAVAAVLRSWRSPRAIEYRHLHKLDDELGTAVTVQAMVFGNLGGTSGAGVAFTRDPALGDHVLYVDYLPNAQGEDIVSGRCPTQGPGIWERGRPELYTQLKAVGQQLEQLFRDAQDFEFTVQEGHLFLLQARSAQRTPWAALRIACDLVHEGIISESAALERLSGYDLDSIQSVRLAAPDAHAPIGQGTPASPGVAVGPIVLDPARAAELARKGRPPILVRIDIVTDDIAGLAAAAGVLTARGGRTSHAAVVARQLNKPCIVNCGSLVLLEDGQSCRIGEHVLVEGADLSLDGNSGQVYAGRVEVVVEKPAREIREVQRWREKATKPHTTATT